MPGDTNQRDDVFVRDRRTGRTERISVAAGGGQADEGSDTPVISADGRFVAFSSVTTNLVPGDTDGSYDVFVRDRWKGRTERISVGQGGAQANDGSGPSAVSADGGIILFVSDADNLIPNDTNRETDVFVRNRRAGTTRRVNVGPGGVQANAPIDGSVSYDGALSPGGRFAVFTSDGTNLVPSDANGRTIDVYLGDLQTGRNERFNVSTAGAQTNGYGSFEPKVAAGGRVVVFTSDATNLVPGDTNGWTDIFVRTR